MGVFIARTCFPDAMSQTTEKVFFAVEMYITKLYAVEFHKSRHNERYM